MKYFIGVLLIALAAWFGLKNTAYSILISRGEVSNPAPLDYTSFDGWASQPDETPPGAWETPWGIDLFVIYPAPRINSVFGLIDAQDALEHPSHVALEAEIRAALPAAANVYVPKYHPLSTTSDVAVSHAGGVLVGETLAYAFEQYLNNTNRGRGVLVVAVGDADESMRPLLGRLRADDLVHRFAGFVHFTANADAANGFDELRCSPALAGACYQSVAMTEQRPIGDYLLPRLPGLRGVLTVIDPEGTGAAIDAQMAQVSAWLDEHTPKPAEPLFGFEAIETAPIYRPNGDALEPVDPEN